MERSELLRQVKARLQEAFGARLRGVILYGSEARGTAEPDSDIDLLILLEGPIDDSRDSWTGIRALYPLVLECGRPIHSDPVEVSEYEAAEFPLYQSAQREGITL
jgi:predicted nucleotidyltransferase